jgi:hypothetical protein
MQTSNGQFIDLIDTYIDFEDDPELSGKAGEQFRRLLSGYFFEKECYDSKTMEFYFNEFPVPPFIEGMSSLFDINLDELRTYIEGEMINESLAGRIMLSKEYLKAFFPQHPPSFAQLPEDTKFELMDKIKDMNKQIQTAFEKMLLDKEADKNRKIITLVALILKKVHRESESPFNKLQKPAQAIINSIFMNADSVFAATQPQMADLKDDTKIKELLKSFFMIKQFKEITEMTEIYRMELERYQKRTLKASGS